MASLENEKDQAADLLALHHCKPLTYGSDLVECRECGWYTKRGPSAPRQIAGHHVDVLARAGLLTFPPGESS